MGIDMDYRDNWDKSRERLKGFWSGEIVDRCCISVFAPKKGSNYIPEKLPSNPADKQKYWTDGEWVLRRNRAQFENTYYAGEATPQIFLDLGAAGHAGYFRNIKWQYENTIWFFPSIHDWEKDRLEFDPDSFLYKKTLELAKYLTDESKGSFFVSMPDIAGNSDALAHLRGSQELLLDFYDEEDNVRASLQKIQEAWLKTAGEVHNIIKTNNDGGSCIGWLNTWAPGKHSQLQCDLGVMISPGTFNDMIMPELKAQCDWLDYPLYHFDGIEQIRHLDSLLSLEKLKAIQWTCVDGQPSPLEFIPVLKRIQEAGKSLLIWIKPNELEPMLEQLSSKGLYLLLRAGSQEEADDMIKKAEKLTHE